MSFSLTVLGSSSAVPAHGRNPSAQLLAYNNHNYLIDSAEGTQMRLTDYRLKRSRIGHIFISHLHGDHYFGLSGLLTTMNLLGQRKPIHIYAPEPLQRILEIQFEASGLQMALPLIFHHLKEDGSQLLPNTGPLEVTAFPLKHRIPCWGFLFREKPQPRNIRKEAFEAYGIPFTVVPKIRAGADFKTPSGEIITNEMITHPASPPRSFAYVSDTLPLPDLVPLYRGVNLLYHEATFLNEAIAKAEETYHTTALQAAELAKMANAGKLLIGHFSGKYRSLLPLLMEARGIFPDTLLAEDGLSVEIE